MLLTFLALIVRLYSLATVPVNLYNDEVVNTYIGRFIFETGHDLYGQKFPLFYSNKFEDYPPVIPMYLSGLATYVFGVNELASRFPAALFGAMTVPLIYFLGRRLSLTSKPSLIAALLFAFSFGHISLSRSSVEVVIALFVFSYGCLFLFKDRRKRIETVFATFLLLLTYIIYPTFRVFVPLFVFIYLFTSHRKTWDLKILLGVTILATFLCSFTVWGRSRFATISVFSEPIAVARYTAQNTAFRLEEPANSQLSKVFHNKWVSIVQELEKNYFSYLSPTYLFLSGGQPLRFAIPNVGITSLVAFLGLVLSLALSWRKANPNRLFLILWLLVSIIPASLTVDEVPSVQRPIMMLIPLTLLSGVGITGLIDLFKNGRLKMLTVVVFVGLFSLETVYGLHQYFLHTQSFESAYRQDGVKELALSLINLNSQTHGKKIIVPDTGVWEGVYYLFYSHKFPKDLPTAGKIMRYPIIDNLVFVQDECPSIHIVDKNIYDYAFVVEKGNCNFYDRFNIALVKTIYRHNSTLAYRIYRVL